MSSQKCPTHCRLSSMVIDPVMRCALSGEDEGEIFGEFEVSKEDLQPERSSSQNETRCGSISSKCLHASSNSPSGFVTAFAAGLQIDLELCAKSPSCTSAHLCKQTSDPPLSPSVDGSNDSPTLASSFSFAGEPALSYFSGVTCALSIACTARLCYARTFLLCSREGQTYPDNNS